MLKSLFYNISHVVVREGVENVFSNLFIGDKVALAKDLQLMGNRRFGHTKKCGDIANTHRRAVYCEKYAHSRGVSEDLEEIRKVVYRALVGHCCPVLFNKLCVELLTFAGRNGDFVLDHFCFLSVIIVEWLFNRLILLYHRAVFLSIGFLIFKPFFRLIPFIF